jgi:tetratricopeptide (TPR) repeat protein
MSPEQASGERELDGRSDQYALGCVLFEMLSGHPPFTGAQVEAVVRQHLTAEPPSVTQARPSVAEEVVRVINRALSKSPADRFRTTREMAAALAGPPTPSKAKTRRGRTKSVFYVGTVILGLATAAVISSRWVAGPSDLPEDVAVVIPFSNETGDPSNDQIGTIVAWRISEALQASGVVKPVPWQAVSSSWDAELERRDAEAAYDPRASVAAELGAGTVVWGSCFSESGNLRFEAEITGEGGDRRIGAIDPVVVSLDSVEKGIEIVGGRVAATLAFHLEPGWAGTTPLISPMPSIAVAQDWVRAYRVSGKDWEETRRLVLRALDRDSTYLPAKLLLAIAHMNLGNLSASDSLLNELEGAYDQMPLFERMGWDWLRARLDGDRETAYWAAKELAERAPSRIGVYSLGFEALSVNRPREALEALLTLNADADWTARVPGYWDYLGRALHILGDHAQELEQAKRGREQHPEDPRVFAAELRALAALGRIQEVNELLDEAVNRDVQPTDLFLLGTRELRAHGHREASLAVGERALAHLQGRPTQVADTEAHRYALLRVLYVLELWDEALPIAEELVRDDPANVPYLGYLGTLASHRGDRSEAIRISGQLADVNRRFLRGSNTYARARIAAVLGDDEQAVSLLRQAHQEGVWLGISIHRQMDFELLRGYEPFEDLMRPKG